MDVLAVLLLVVAVAIFLAGRLLARRQAAAAQNLAMKLREGSRTHAADKRAPGGAASETAGDPVPGTAAANSGSGESPDSAGKPEDWDAMWDAAEEEFNQDVYKLLNTASGIFKGLALVLGAGAIVLLLAARFL